LRASSIATALLGKARASVLGLVYSRSDRPFFYREITRELRHLSPGTIQRELRNLESLGLITRSGSANQVFYQANMQAPAAQELKSFLQKSSGLLPELKESLAKLGHKVQIAFVYGSIAEERERAESDVDLMVIGRAKLEDVVEVVSPVEQRFKRPINPTVYSIEDFHNKVVQKNHFLTAVLKRKKAFLIGDMDDLGRLGKERLAGR
jgi:predicted nucleotidyltransferase